MANEPSSTSNFVQIEDKVINKVVDASITSNDISLNDSVFIFKKNSDGQIDKVVNASVQWLVDEFGKEAVQAKTDAISAKDAASTSATNAKASETSASGSATKALASETNAKTSETNASTYAGQAKTSETNAKASETASKTYKEQAQSLLEQADLNLIESIVQTTTSTESSGKNVVTITQKDGTKSTFDVYNGAKGDTPTIAQASSSTAGIMKLFSSLGQATDGAPTNKAVQDAISAISASVSNKPDASFSKNDSGHVNIGGLIIQWGTLNRSNSDWGANYVTFPRAFPSKCYNIVVCSKWSSAGGSYQYRGDATVGSWSTTGANFYTYSGATEQFCYIAIGV